MSVSRVTEKVMHGLMRRELETEQPGHGHRSGTTSRETAGTPKAPGPTASPCHRASSRPYSGMRAGQPPAAALFRRMARARAVLADPSEPLGTEDACAAALTRAGFSDVGCAVGRCSSRPKTSTTPERRTNAD